MFSQGEEFVERASLGLPDELLTACHKLLKNPRLRGSLGTKRQGENVILESAPKRIKACLRLIKCQEGFPLVIIYLDQKDPVFSSCECLEKDGLTRREVEVAILVCEGLRDKDIAERLFISEYTVGNHLKAIYEKLGVRNRTSLIHRVIRREASESTIDP
jgi:DNA-binding NarL/FixJ family response regulator